MPAPVALTIAGLDPTGAAGIVADVRVLHQLGVAGRAVLTFASVQGPRGVTRVVPMAADLVDEQLAAVLELGRPQALKTGALGSEAVVRVVAARLAAEKLAPVVDPVLLSSSGHPLLDEGGRRAMRELLVPIARLVTPNAPEAEALTGIAVDDVTTAEEAGRVLLDLGAEAALVKGGHLDGPEAIDVLVTRSGALRFARPRSPRRDFRGTGCSLSAAITGLLARGDDLETSISVAKEWLSSAIESAAPANGRNAVDHFAPFPLRAKPPL